MYRLMLLKLWRKKWMSICLLLGIVLLIATVISFPMYRAAAYNRMLQDQFDQYVYENGDWPAMNLMAYSSRGADGGANVLRIEQFIGNMDNQLGLIRKDLISYYCTSRVDAVSLMNRSDVSEIGLRIGFLSNVEDHLRLLSGEMRSESGFGEDGCLEALISQAGMVNSNLLLGETVEFPKVKDPDGNPLRVRVVGIFEAADPDDVYWQVKPEDMSNVLLIKEELFRDYFTGERSKDFNFTTNYYDQWDYTRLEAEQVDDLVEQTRDMIERGAFKSIFSEPPYLQLLNAYQQKRERIDALLLMLQVPIWILLGTFLFMISAQMYDVEQNEISVIKSRGSSALQIFRMYLSQSVVLTLLGAVLGLPLGKLFAGFLGATRSFLEFRLTRSLTITYTESVFRYAAAAMAGCVLMITLPAIKHSRLSIVNAKQQKARLKHSWWEICCMDFICLGISLYGYHFYTENQNMIYASALSGEPMDMLFYVSSSLFIIGAGLLLLRLQPLLIQLIYFIGQRFWKPAAYISFMENRKNGRKQHFIMIFLILSISVGMYHATAARTILENTLENTAHLDGADLVVKEVWSNTAAWQYEGVAAALTYTEPDYGKYAFLEGINSYTRVINDPQAHFYGGNFNGVPITIMGIQTKEFGRNTEMPKGLMEKHYYEYLNELALEPYGVLASSYVRDVMGYKIGDTVQLYNKDSKRFTATILDFVEYWPGFSPMDMTLYPDGQLEVEPKYLFVANIAALNDAWGTFPYEVWIDTDGEKAAGFYEWLDKYDVRVERYVDKQADLKDVVEEPLMQGTNGILTMGFLVTMLLCATGYMIYWILSIRSREMVFGILRAQGMHKGEIFHLLINEQIFCGGFSILAGALIGYLSSRMFVPILQMAFGTSEQVLPTKLVIQSGDMFRLFGVVGGVMVICLLLLAVIVWKLNVAKALKIGEE